MKKARLLSLFIVSLIICIGYYTNAQPFNTVGTASNYYGETDAGGASTNWIRKIGIGNFSSNTDEPHAFLHVNSNYLLLPANGSITGIGEVLWTDCPTGTGAADVSAWRMLRNAVEQFNIINPYNTTDIHLGTVQNGDLYSVTNNIDRMVIMGHNTLTSPLNNTGYVGIGTASIPPTCQLDVMNAININTATFTAATTYYMVDGVTILQNLGNSNIFVGEGAGNLVVANLTGQGNACLGRLAGNSIEDGDQNVCIGTGAGRFSHFLNILK